MSTIDIPDPQLPDWIKLLNTYDPTHYIPGKTVTADEWNTLFLASVNQGNYLANTMELLIDTYLPETFVSNVDFEEYKENISDSLQALIDMDVTLNTSVNNAINTANTANTNSQIAKANSEQAIQVANSAQDDAQDALATANSATVTANTAKTTADSATTLANNANTTANNAMSIVNEAEDTATEAKTIAEGVDAKATSALNTANTFRTVAETAYTQAVTAAQNAEDALGIGNTALENSREAMARAEQAINVAFAIDGKAEQAIDNADTALTNSKEAVEDSTNALLYATEALSKIDQAIEQGGSFVIDDNNNAIQTLTLTSNLNNTNANSTPNTQTLKNQFDVHATAINQLSEATESAITELQNNINTLETDTETSINTLQTYVDNTFLPLTGGQMTGNIFLPITHPGPDHGGIYDGEGHPVLTTQNGIQAYKDISIGYGNTYKYINLYGARVQTAGHLTPIPAYADNKDLGTSSLTWRNLYLSGTANIGSAIINGDITINGNITQNGEAYETHAEKIYTTNDYIILRNGATGALASGDYTGLEFVKYDGTNNGRLVVDNTGTARVGDIADEQPLATRAEADDLQDNGIIYWNSTENRLETNGAYPTVDNLVTRTGSAQTIDSQKTFTQELIKSQSSGFAGYSVRNTEYTRGDAPSTTTGLGRFIIKDSDDQFLSYLQTKVDSEGTITTELQTRQATTEGGNSYQTTVFGLLANPTYKYIYSGANIQPSVNSTYDLGTKDFRWRNAYLQKIYTYDTPIIKANSIDLTENPTTTQYKFVDFIDGNDTRIGVTGATQDTAGNYGMYMQAGNFASMGIKGTSSSDAYTWAPTPPSEDDSTKIATTAWVNDKISAVNTSINNIINNTTKIANSTYGAAFGTNSSTTYGGAVGLSATSTTGGAMGNGSETTNGGAIGNASSSENGGAVGYGAVTTTGGAVGGNAKATNGGGAIGYVSNTTSGGAVGSGAYSTTGGAIGNGATATVGFSGGQNAKSSVDSVQLGTGTNSTAKTLQVYNDNIYNANTHTLTVQNIDNVWTCFYDDALTTNDVNAVSINNIFDFDNYDYKIEMTTIMTNSSGNTWNSETIMGYYINSSGNIVQCGNITWSRHYSNENYTTSGGTQQGTFIPHGYGGSWVGNDVAFQDWDTNDGDGDVLFQAKITPVNYGKLIQLWRWVRNSVWQQTDYKYSGMVIPNTTAHGTITGIRFRINSGTGYFKANAGHIKIYRRPGGWNNYLGG